MRTPRRHRLTRRQSEHLLDGLGGPDDLTRLLADARPLRAIGEQPGEAVAVTAFRSAGVAALDPQPRSDSVRTLSLRRALAVKVLAVAVSSMAVGGVAMAAGGHLPGPLKAVPATSRTAHPTAKPSVIEAGESVDVDRRTAGKAHPSGSPTDRSGHREDPGYREDPGHREDSVRAIGLCRAWDEVKKHNAGALTQSTRFQELATKAGGSAEVAQFCDRLTTGWCESHRWPAYQPVQIDGKPLTMRCIRPNGKPTALPTGGKTRIPVPPTRPVGPVGPGSGKSIPLPTGGPARN